MGLISNTTIRTILANLSSTVQPFMSHTRYLRPVAASEASQELIEPVSSLGSGLEPP